jgi:hypothetical protein
MVCWVGFGLWNGCRGTFELITLKTSGKVAQAQVTGYEPLPKSSRVGYVHYAIHIAGGSIDNRFPLPVARYTEYPIGAGITVTYLPEQPHVMRMGKVDVGRVSTTALFAVVFVVLGLAGFGVPLFAISAAGKKIPAQK